MADGKQVDPVKEHVSPPVVQRPPLPALIQPRPPPPPPPQALKSCPLPPTLIQPPPPPPPRLSLLQPTHPPLPESTSQAVSTHTPVGSAEVDGNKERDDDHQKMPQGLGKRSLGAIKIQLKQQPGIKKTKFDSPADKVLGNKSLSKSVVTAFGSDSEGEEDMPAEAKLRMRNVGKNTPTSAGPNSFNKSRGGFSDPRGSWRNELTD